MNKDEDLIVNIYVCMRVFIDVCTYVYVCTYIRMNIGCYYQAHFSDSCHDHDGDYDDNNYNVNAYKHIYIDM
jgi:hypothetical protein